MPARKHKNEFDESPFHLAPADGNGHELDAIMRIAKAAEYSAEQLAAIARTVEKIESRLSKMEDDREADEENLVYEVRTQPYKGF